MASLAMAPRRTPLRVVHVDSAREWRGGQRQLLLVAESMAARGHSVTIACRAGGQLETRSRAAGLAVLPLAFGGDLAPGAFLGLARLLRREAPDVVHAHDPHATASAVLALRLRPGARLVASRRVALPLRGTFSKRKYAACDRVIAVSRAVARVLAEGGLPASRIRLIYDGVPDRSSRAGGGALRELDIPADAPVIGNVAALTEHKDHATLLAAMPAVLAAVPDARLVLVGDGALRARLEREALRLGLGQRCLFAGFQPDPDRLIPAFSMLCLTSRTEGLGSSLLDGMCFERAIVATTTGGIPEVVHHGRTGLLVPVGDVAALARALLELLRWPERRQALGRAGRRRFEREFTAERMVEATLGLYEDLCPLPRCDSVFRQEVRRRFLRPRPSRPLPSSASVAGSGTGLTSILSSE